MRPGYVTFYGDADLTSLPGHRLSEAHISHKVARPVLLERLDAAALEDRDVVGELGERSCRIAAGQRRVEGIDDGHDGCFVRLSEYRRSQCAGEEGGGDRGRGEVSHEGSLV